MRVSHGFTAGPNERAFLLCVIETDPQGTGLAAKVGEGGDEPVIFGGIVHGGEVTTQVDGGGLSLAPVTGGQQKIAVSRGRIINGTGKNAGGLSGGETQATADDHDP